MAPRPQLPHDPGRTTRRKDEALPLLSAFDFSRILHRHGESYALSLGLPYLSLLCGLLHQSIAEEISVDKTLGDKTEDYSFVWQARLESTSYHAAAKYLIIPALLNAAEALCRSDVANTQPIVELLGKNHYKVYDRITLRLLSQYAGAVPQLARDRFLNKSTFLDRSTRQEYEALAAAIFPLLPATDQQTYLDWIEEGGDLRRFEGRGYTPEAIAIAIERWKFERMSPLKAVLPENLRARFRELEATFGEAKSYANPIAQGGAYAISDESPMNREVLAAMDAGKAVDYLRTWKPTPNDPFPFGYSKQGLGAVLLGVVSDFPERFIPHLEEIKTLDPVYIGNIIRGFSNAIQTGKSLAIQPVFALMLWVAVQPEVQPAQPNAEDEEIDFSGVKHDVIDLIREGLRHQRIPISERETTWKIIDRLSEDHHSILDYREPKALKMDAWYNSVNYLRPKAVRAAMEYLQWTALTSGQNTFAFSQVPELANYFDRHIEPANDPSLSVRLIFGESFPLLHALDPTWATAAPDHIFPDAPEFKPLRDIAWTAYLSANQAYDAVFSLLEPKYRAAISINDEDRVLGKSSSLEGPSGLLGYHIVQQYWQGKTPLSPGSLLSDFFLNADERGRRAAIVYVGRSLREATEEVPADVLSRLAALWDYRLEEAKAGRASGEIKAFSWWFFTQYFEDEWALNSLHKALGLTNGQMDLIMESLGRLSQLAAKYPAIAVECAQMMADAAPEYVELWTTDFITILSAALRSSDGAARQSARDLIEDLGVKGRMEYRNLLSIDPE